MILAAAKGIKLHKPQTATGAEYIPDVEIPLTQLAAYVAGASWFTPGGKSDVQSILDLGGTTGERQKATAQEALFEQLWRVVSLGVDRAGVYMGFLDFGELPECEAAGVLIGSPAGQVLLYNDPCNGIYFVNGVLSAQATPDKKLARSMPPLNDKFTRWYQASTRGFFKPTTIIKLALAWELSENGPSGTSQATRVSRLIARAQQVIYTPECDYLSSATLHGEPVRNMIKPGVPANVTWAAFGSQNGCQAVQSTQMAMLTKRLKMWRTEWGYTGAMASYGDASPEALDALVINLSLFIFGLAKAKETIYLRGPIPSPSVNWLKVFEFLAGAVFFAFTGNLYGLFELSLDAADSADSFQKPTEIKFDFAAAAHIATSGT